MQEILSKTRDPNVPLRDQEFYELRLFEKLNQREARYCVGETQHSGATWIET
jgi:hypothetical protein